MEEMAFFDHPNVNVPALKPPKHVLHRPPNTKRLKKTRIPVDHDGSDSAPWRFLVLNFLEAGLLWPHSQATILSTGCPLHLSFGKWNERGPRIGARNSTRPVCNSWRDTALQTRFVMSWQTPRRHSWRLKKSHVCCPVFGRLRRFRSRQSCWSACRTRVRPSSGCMQGKWIFLPMLEHSL